MSPHDSFRIIPQSVADVLIPLTFVALPYIARFM